MKKLEILVRSNPVNPKFGYGDQYEIKDGKSILFSGHCSTCPNPFSIQTNWPWEECYGWIAPGEYPIQATDHKKYGRCLLINDGLSVASRNPNPNHDKEKIMSEVFIHKGAIASENPNWRGSRGCPTVPPWDWDKFISCFGRREKGILIIKDFLDNRGPKLKEEPMATIKTINQEPKMDLSTKKPIEKGATAVAITGGATLLAEVLESLGMPAMFKPYVITVASGAAFAAWNWLRHRVAK